MSSNCKMRPEWTRFIFVGLGLASSYEEKVENRSDDWRFWSGVVCKKEKG